MMELSHVADLTVLVGSPIEIGQTPAGRRRVIPITGGEVRGPLLQGRVLPGGADYQLIRPDGVAELHARYVIECADGARIYVENSGLRHGAPEDMERLARGEVVDPALVYFHTTPRFETSEVRYLWLTQRVFTAEGARHPASVELAIYQVL